MKIVCIGRNYLLHAQEMGSELPREPIFFLKPLTALAPDGEVPYPPFTQELHYEAELVFRIGRAGKNIPQEKAFSHLDAITVGIDFTARDIQTALKRQGLPWEKAKAFDRSAYVGAWHPIPPQWDTIPFVLKKNAHKVQEARGKDMIFSPAFLVSHISQFIQWEAGDYLFTGTPAGVGPLSPQDHLTLYWGNHLVGEVFISA
ncbi:MAG: fumarylacetoacetate hydrolase family protein [Bacteroidia bacterium]